jgi:large subunit ribosomal protein L19
MSDDIRLQIKPGQTVKVYQKIKEVNEKGEEKERLQAFEGIVIALHGQKPPSATFTVRKQSHGVGVEKIFPIFSPIIAKIEIVSQAKVHRAKLYFLRRGYTKKLKEVT